jgi:hypothetical protein
MSDRALFPLMGLFAVAMIALALVWPQGQGARSPGPFGHAPTTPAAAAAKPAEPPPLLGMAPAAPVRTPENSR